MNSKIISNKVIIVFATKNIPSWSNITINLPISFTSTKYAICNHCDLKNVSKTVSSFKGEYAWGNGSGYGTVYYSCIGY